MTLRKVPTAKMTEAEWLEARKHTIGGSEAAAIVGLDRYATAYSVWHKKKGLVEETATSLPAEFGHYAEEFVAQLFERETGKKVRKENAIIYNSDYPFAHANIDRKIVGENAGLECKTTSALNLKRFKGGEYPARYYVQCMHYMMVCGFERMYLACLIGNSQFKVFTIERDDAEIEALAAAEREFFDTLQGDTPPFITAADCDTETLSEVYNEPNGEAIQLDLDEAFKQLEESKQLKKEVEETIKLIENTIKAALGNNERGTTDNYRCSWTSFERRSYDTERLFAEHPEIDREAYTKTTTSRTFRFSKIPKEDE